MAYIIILHLTYHVIHITEEFGQSQTRK